MDYGYLYHLMFNAATDAMEYIDKGETDLQDYVSCWRR